MQACARIAGATPSVVFGGFSAKSLHERIRDAGAVAVVTADEQHRGGKINHLKAAVDEALAMGGTDFVKSVIVYKRGEGNPPLNTPRDIWWHELTHEQDDVCEPEVGSTPRPVIHALPHLRLYG